MDALPDPLALAWPRTYNSCHLRPVTMGDVDAILSYRSLPEVVRYLNHPVLDRAGVAERIRQRTASYSDRARTVTRGLAVEVGGTVVGDAMMRVELDNDRRGGQCWIGYAFHPQVWGRGYATQTATCLASAGQELGLRVWADTVAGNVASERALIKAGLQPQGQRMIDGSLRNLFATTALEDGGSGS